MRIEKEIQLINEIVCEDRNPVSIFSSTELVDFMSNN